MEDNLSSFKRNNRWVGYNNNRNSNNSYTPFFRVSSERRTKRIESHHAELLEVHGRWYDYELPVIDFDTFNPQYLKLSQLGQGEILKDYALSHLKYYKNASKKYECASKLYDKFNQHLDKFLDNNREHLRELLNSYEKVHESNLNHLLRLYLYMITSHYKNNETLDRIPVIDYGYNENPVFSWLNLRNPFRNKENEIIQDLKTRRDEVISQINELIAIKELFETEVTDFKDLLKPIIINKGLGLKGKCGFEKQPSLKGRIRSYLRIH